MRLDPGAALAWRLERHGLAVPADLSVTEVARRVLAARAWPAEAAADSFAVRRRTSEPGAVARALEAGELVQSYAFRGGSYVFTPEIAAALLAVRTTSRAWESRRWQRQIGVEISDWEPLRDAVCDRLASGPATRAEIADHLRTTRSLRHLAAAAETGAGADSLYKPLHWWGDIAFGPPRGKTSTFRLLRADPRWPGLPDSDDAGRHAVRLYLAQYGPATTTNLRYWLVEGLSAPRRRLEGWWTDLERDISAVDLGGEPAYALTETLAGLATTAPSQVVRLLPAYDPWLIGPGTADTRIVPAEHRGLFSAGAAPVVRGGRVVGTWRRRGGKVEIDRLAGPGAAV